MKYLIAVKLLNVEESSIYEFYSAKDRDDFKKSTKINFPDAKFVTTEIEEEGKQK